ncbi:MAG TPA: alpha/beta fold hydrolase [Ramlibacter sp.]|nr:alpha/beta fold hydrolase [Ramlibacter sp.]
MGPRSSLARLEQATTLFLLSCALGWLAWHWRDSPGTAAAGFIVITMAYSAFLAIEFVALRFVNRNDASPRPTWGELARAWLRETVMAPRVFCWRQPFRWREVPDQLETSSALPARRGAVFIHGFVCNRGFWTPWLKEMRARGHSFVAVNLEPVFGSIDEYVPIVEHAVRRITEATGMAPVLVCHSMGGLAARAWLRAMSADERVHHVITIGSPHHGTWLGRFSRMTNGRQMRLQSQWLRQLERGCGPQRNANFTCWYSNCDNIAFPASTGSLEGADNRLVRGAAHVDLGFHHQVMAESLALIAAG